MVDRLAKPHTRISREVEFSLKKNYSKRRKRYFVESSVSTVSLQQFFKRRTRRGESFAVLYQTRPNACDL